MPGDLHSVVALVVRLESDEAVVAWDVREAQAVHAVWVHEHDIPVGVVAKVEDECFVFWDVDVEVDGFGGEGWCAGWRWRSGGGALWRSGSGIGGGVGSESGGVGREPVGWIVRAEDVVVGAVGGVLVGGV